VIVEKDRETFRSAGINAVQLFEGMFSALVHIRTRPCGPAAVGDESTPNVSILFARDEEQKKQKKQNRKNKRRGKDLAMR